MKSLVKKIITQKQQGFTLVEFIVIMSIFAIMVGVVLFNFTTFRSRVTLDNLAHDIALSIRQVQTSAGASRTIDPNDPEYEAYRGIAFTREGDTFKKDFIVYETESSSDSAYYGGLSTIVDTISINTPDSLTRITTGDSIDTAIADGAEEISDSDSGYVSIAFKRFFTEANFSPNLPKEHQYMCIQMQSSDEESSRHVCISKIGQISIH